MSEIPPLRYASADDRIKTRLDSLESGAPVEFDTLSEIAAELLSLRSQLAALQASSGGGGGGGTTTEISLLLE